MLLKLFLQVLKKADMIRKNAVESILAERDILISLRNPFVVRRYSADLWFFFDGKGSRISFLMHNLMINRFDFSTPSRVGKIFT